jgi:large subunit ribosomal protein L29
VKARELRDLVDDELLTRLGEAKQELFNLRFQHVTGQLDNYARLSQVRRDIARAETVLRERELSVPDEGVGVEAPTMAPRHTEEAEEEPAELPEPEETTDA